MAVALAVHIDLVDSCNLAGDSSALHEELSWVDSEDAFRLEILSDQRRCLVCYRGIRQRNQSHHGWAVVDMEALEDKTVEDLGRVEEAVGQDYHCTAKG